MEADKFFEAQYPKHMNSLTMTGGYIKENDTDFRNEHYKKGTHYGYNKIIY